MAVVRSLMGMGVTVTPPPPDDPPCWGFGAIGMGLEGAYMVGVRRWPPGEKS